MGAKINNGSIPSPLAGEGQGEGGLYTLAANIGDSALQRHAEELRTLAGENVAEGFSPPSESWNPKGFRYTAHDRSLALAIKNAWASIYGADVNQWPQELKDSLASIEAGIGLGSFNNSLISVLQYLRVKEETVPAFEVAQAVVAPFMGPDSPINRATTSLIPESAARAGLGFISDPMTLVIPMWAAGTAGRAAAGLLASGGRALQLAESAVTAISVAFSLPVEAAAFMGTSSVVAPFMGPDGEIDSPMNRATTFEEFAASTAFFASLKVFGWMGAVAQGLLPVTEVGMSIAKLTGHVSSIFGLAATEGLQPVVVAPFMGPNGVIDGPMNRATTFYEKLWRAGFLHGVAQAAYGIVDLKNATSASDEILARSKSFVEALRSNMAQEAALATAGVACHREPRVGNVIPAGVGAEPAASYWRGDLVRSLNFTVRSEGGETTPKPANPTAQTIDELEVVIANYEKVKQAGGDIKTVEKEAQEAVLNAYRKALSIITDYENNAIELSDHFLKYIEQIYSGYLRLLNPVMAGSIVKRVIDFLDRVEQTRKPVPAFVSEVAEALDKMFKGRSNALTRAIEDHLYKLACILARLKGEPLPPDPSPDGYITTPEISIAGKDTAEISRAFTEWVNKAGTVQDVESFNARLLALAIDGTQNGVEVDRTRAVIKYTLLKDLFGILSEKIVNIQGKDKYDERRRGRTIKGLRASIRMAEERIRMYSKEAKPTNAQPELEAKVEQGSNISTIDPIAGRDLLIEAAEAYVELAEKIKATDEKTYRSYCRKAGMAYDWASHAMQTHAEKIIERADLLARTGKNEEARQSYKEAREALDQAIQYSNKEMILYPEISKNLEDRLRQLQILKRHVAPKMPDLKPDIHDKIRTSAGLKDIDELYHKTLAETPEGKAFEALHDGHFSREDIPGLVQKTFMLSTKISAMLERAQDLNKDGRGDVLIQMMKMSIEEIERLLKKYSAPVAAKPAAPVQAPEKVAETTGIEGDLQKYGKKE